MPPALDSKSNSTLTSSTPPTVTDNYEHLKSITIPSRPEPLTRLPTASDCSASTPTTLSPRTPEQSLLSYDTDRSHRSPDTSSDFLTHTPPLSPANTLPRASARQASISGSSGSSMSRVPNAAGFASATVPRRAPLGQSRKSSSQSFRKRTQSSPDISSSGDMAQRLQTLAAAHAKLLPARPSANPHDSTSSCDTDDESAKRKTLYKTELCRSWEENGHCRYGAKCKFAHTEKELRRVERHPKYKTEMCKTFWEKGTCPYGRRCCFIHTQELPEKLPDGDVSYVIRSPDQRPVGRPMVPPQQIASQRAPNLHTRRESTKSLHEDDHISSFRAGREPFRKYSLSASTESRILDSVARAHQLQQDQAGFYPAPSLPASTTDDFYGVPSLVTQSRPRVDTIYPSSQQASPLALVPVLEDEATELSHHLTGFRLTETDGYLPAFGKDSSGFGSLAFPADLDMSSYSVPDYTQPPNSANPGGLRRSRSVNHQPPQTLMRAHTIHSVQPVPPPQPPQSTSSAPSTPILPPFSRERTRSDGGQLKQPLMKAFPNPTHPLSPPTYSFLSPTSLTPTAPFSGYHPDDWASSPFAQLAQGPPPPLPNLPAAYAQNHATLFHRK